MARTSIYIYIYIYIYWRATSIIGGAPQYIVAPRQNIDAINEILTNAPVYIYIYIYIYRRACIYIDTGDRL